MFPRRSIPDLINTSNIFYRDWMHRPRCKELEKFPLGILQHAMKIWSLVGSSEREMWASGVFMKPRVC